ncbi:PQQ-binding-like beta-propeller repeat protein [Candidatus Poribacteria bacterium]|nr:PQQ-binding-like beta-propeller repeat protein [Candidatus Poribacteria bacterium]
MGCDNGYVYCVSHSGELLWKFKTGSLVLSFSVGDVDGDGRAEIAAPISAPMAYHSPRTGEHRTGFSSALRYGGSSSSPTSLNSSPSHTREG